MGQWQWGYWGAFLIRNPCIPSLNGYDTRYVLMIKVKTDLKLFEMFVYKPVKSDKNLSGFER